MPKVSNILLFFSGCFALGFAYGTYFPKSDDYMKDKTNSHAIKKELETIKLLVDAISNAKDKAEMALEAINKEFESIKALANANDSDIE